MIGTIGDPFFFVERAPLFFLFFPQTLFQEPFPTPRRRVTSSIVRSCTVLAGASVAPRVGAGAPAAGSVAAPGPLSGTSRQSAPVTPRAPWVHSHRVEEVSACPDGAPKDQHTRPRLRRRGCVGRTVRQARHLRRRSIVCTTWWSETRRRLKTEDGGCSDSEYATAAPLGENSRKSET